MIKSFVTGQLSLLLSAGREMNTGQSGDALPLEDGSFHPYVSLDKRAGGTWNCDLSLTRDNLDASGIIDRAYYKALGLYKSPVYFTYFLACTHRNIYARIVCIQDRLKAVINKVF